MPDLSSMPYPHLTFLILMNVPHHQVHSPTLLQNAHALLLHDLLGSWRLKGVYWHGMAFVLMLMVIFTFIFTSFPSLFLCCHTTSVLFQGCRMLVQLTSYHDSFWSIEACSRHCSKSFRGEGGYQIVNIVNKPWGWTHKTILDTGIQTEVLSQF